jgi:hypothetical protein
MDEAQTRRAVGVITHLRSALERGIQHFDGAGKRLNDVSSIIEAWTRGNGLVVKEPENHQVMEKWLRQ